MRTGVGQLETAIAVAKFAVPAISTALGVASFFGKNGKKRPYVTAAENKAIEEHACANLVSGRLRAIHKRLQQATTVDAIESERLVLPKLWEKTHADALKNYGKIFGAAAADKAWQNLSAWRRPYYDQGESQVEAMIAERIAMLDAPARAAAAAKEKLAAEARFASTIAAAVRPPTGEISTSMILLIGGGLAAAWFVMKGKKR